MRLLQDDARRTLADIAEHVNLSVAPVKRRIDRLEDEGIIAGYTAVLNDSKLGSALDAFVQLRLVAGADAATVMEAFQRMPEVREIMMTAGEQDALVRVSVDDVEQLKVAVLAIRRTGAVVETRTHIVMDRWLRAGSHPVD